ncbi:MAG: hypothetical protein ACKO5X_02390 [Limnohabitans sp.]
MKNQYSKMRSKVLWTTYFDNRRLTHKLSTHETCRELSYFNASMKSKKFYVFGLLIWITIPFSALAQNAYEVNENTGIEFSDKHLLVLEDSSNSINAEQARLNHWVCGCKDRSFSH